VSADPVQALAYRQRGYVKTAQLLALGVGSQAIRYRASARAGILIRVYDGVYAVGHVPVAAVDRAAGALLACGPEAMLSHSSAMSLWVSPRAGSCRSRSRRQPMHRRRGIRVHRSTALTRADVRVHLGLRVTSPARTLLDNAPRRSERQLTRAVNDARLSGHLRLAALQDVIARFPRHPGAGRLRPLTFTPDAPTRSWLENEFMAFVERYNLPRPRLNTKFAGREVDALFEAERLIVEIDGYSTHSNRYAFEDDRERDANSLALGAGTVRITRERLTQRPAAEAERLHAILADRRRVLAALAAAQVPHRRS
jgi:very-short-patch-repair endonuclease